MEFWDFLNTPIIGVSSILWIALILIAIGTYYGIYKKYLPGFIPLFFGVMIVLSDVGINMTNYIKSNHAVLFDFMNNKAFGVSNGKIALLLIVILGMYNYSHRTDSNDKKWIYITIIAILCMIILFPFTIFSW